MLEELGASPETVVQLLLQVDTETFVVLERIVELVSSLEPGDDEDDCEELVSRQGEKCFSYWVVGPGLNF